YLHDVLQLVDLKDFDPSYHDAMAKLQWTAGDATILSAHVLLSADRLSSTSLGAFSRYSDQWVWLGMHTAPSARVLLTSVASLGTLKTDRHGDFGDEVTDERGSVEDVRRTRVVALKNEAIFDVAGTTLAAGL